MSRSPMRPGAIPAAHPPIRPLPPLSPRPAPTPAPRPPTPAPAPFVPYPPGAIGLPQKPGEHPQKPAEYEERGPNGQPIRNPREVTIEPGDPKLPPTQKPGRTWVPVLPRR